MARYQVVLAYDGADFKGFQRQKNARTVQSAFETALRALGWTGKSLLSAGRTDSGVHAVGQVVAFDFEWSHDEVDLLRALNASLPVDIAAREVHLTARDFHPRYDALARRYEYRVFCDPIRDPLRERYAWRVWPEVRMASMNQAASYLIGEHDFGAFGAPPRKGGRTQRVIYQACWREAGRDLLLEITGNAFLFHMVRKLVSLLVEIGHGKQEIGAVEGFLDGVQPENWQGLAPPQGLTLMEVTYPAVNPE
jgi:tRNA pseudouridine38-40 synthase